MSNPLAILAVYLDRSGHHEPAATISGFAANPMTRTAFPEINTATSHLREVLGDAAYESFASAGEHMTSAAMAAYALDQIDQARAALAWRACAECHDLRRVEEQTRTLAGRGSRG